MIFSSLCIFYCKFQTPVESGVKINYILTSHFAFQRIIFWGVTRGTVIFLFFILFAFSAFGGGNTISATGVGRLIDVPLGRDSLFTTNIVGINRDSTASSCFTFKFSSGGNGGFYENLPNLNWISIAFDSACAPPMGKTKPLEVITNFPDDSTLLNRRFSTNLEVKRSKGGGISISILLKLFMETGASRALYPGSGELMLAPSSILLSEEWDSILIYNDSGKTDTIDIFWTPDLDPEGLSRSGVTIGRKAFMWFLPLIQLILKPGKFEYIYFQKDVDYTGPDGYISVAGRSKSLYCDLTTGPKLN